MTSIILGLLTVALGISSLFCWQAQACFALKSLLAVSLICSGGIALAAGVSSLRK